MPQPLEPDTQMLLARFIECNRRTIRCHVYLGVGIALCGVVVIIVGALWPGKVVDKLLPVFAGLCVTGFTTFPIKEIRSRQEKIELLEGVPGQFVLAQNQSRYNELL